LRYRGLSDAQMEQVRPWVRLVGRIGKQLLLPLVLVDMAVNRLETLLASLLPYRPSKLSHELVLLSAVVLLVVAVLLAVALVTD
jgi:hypothetical protein